jgi:hypothetical protein
VIRQYALGFLIPPVLFLAVGWSLLQTGRFDGVAFLAFVGTPVAVMVLGWAAVVVHQIANRRSGRGPQQHRSTRFLVYYRLAPVLYLLVGWGALRAGSINEAYVLAVAGAPAAVLTLAWIAVAAHEIAGRRCARRRRDD